MIFKGKECRLTFGYVNVNTPEEQENLMKVIEENSDPKNWHKTIILEEGEKEMDFRVGDEVVDIILDKEGIVKRIDNDEYPVIVEFEDGTIEEYMSNGAYYDDEVVPRLYHKGTTFEINAAKPKRKKYLNLYKNEHGAYKVSPSYPTKKLAEYYSDRLPDFGAIFVKTIEVD